MCVCVCLCVCDYHVIIDVIKTLFVLSCINTIHTNTTYEPSAYILAKSFALPPII